MSTNTIAKPRLTGWNKLGYGFGAGEIFAYNLYTLFFLIFLTNVAMIPPAIAGVIIFLGVIWDAISDPIIGAYSDNRTSPKGRRRPMMLFAIIPFALTTLGLYIVVPGALGVKIAYYIVMSLLFWTSMTIWHVAFFSLGAEMTSSYDERTSINTYRTGVQTAAGCLSGFFPMTLVTLFAAKNGGNFSAAWTTVAFIFALCCAVMMFVAYFSTKGKENLALAAPKEKREKESVIQRLKDAFSIKSFVVLTLGWMFIMFGNSLSASAVVYYLTYRLQLAPLMLSLFLVFAMMGLPWTPVVNFVSKKLGKTKTLIIFLLGGCMANGIILYFLTPESPIFIGFIAAFLFAAGNACFWAIIWSMAFDVTDIDEFKTGKRREGLYMGLISLFQKVFTAFCASLVGVVLATSGYVADAAQQTPSALEGIRTVTCVLPAICFFIAVLIMSRYPLSGKRHDALRAALEAKREGKEFSTEGFEMLL